jgi:hypothetical protein
MRTDGHKEKVKEIAFTPPPDGLVEEYEPRKDEFVSQFAEDAVERAKEELEEDTEQTPQEVAEEVIEDDRVEEFISHHGQTGRPYVDKDLLAAEYDLSVRKSNTAKKLIERDVELSEQNKGHTP